MKKIGLVVDEGADLPQEIIKKYEIEVLPFVLNWKEVENLPGENIFQKMREVEKRGLETFPKTSQPSPKAFFDTFKKALEKFEKIICITISSKLSGTYNSACQAKNFLLPNEAERVFIIDSLNVSCGEGLLAIKALDLIEKGKEIKEIVEILKKKTSEIQLRGILRDPKWLESAGRISKKVASFLRKMQKIGIKPMLGVKEGAVKAVGIKIRAKNPVQTLFKELKVQTRKEREKGRKIMVAITHGDCKEMAEELKKEIEENLPNTKVLYINLLDKVVGAVTGPETLICSWISDS